MSRFISQKFEKLVPYTPGEQPQDKKYIKLNTNESPFPPSDKAVSGVSDIFKRLMLYPDPECTGLNEKFAKLIGVEKDEVMAVKMCIRDSGNRLSVKAERRVFDCLGGKRKICKRQPEGAHRVG